MIDIHSHILPGIDDGAKSMEDAVTMINKACENGVEGIIATPHYCRGYYENEYENIKDQLNDLNLRLSKENIPIKIYTGQEVYIDSKTLELHKKGILKGLNNSKYMLVEFPMEQPERDALDIIYELKLRDVVPIIAHPERYLYVIDDITYLNDFIDEKCLFQVNTGSIKGIFGNDVRKTAEKLFKNDLVDFIASDAHTTNNRSTGLMPSLEIIKDINPGFKDKFQDNCIKLINNDDIECYHSKIENKKRFFNLFRR